MGRKKKDSLTAHNKRAILEAASELFLKNGVVKTSMDEIAKEADYSKSTIYVYFKNKDDILNHLTNDGMTLFKERMMALSEAHKNVPDFLLGICHLMVELHDGHPFYFRGLIGKIETNEEITRDDPIIKNIYETNEFIQNIVLERMREGHERGLITVDQPALETMLTAWFGICGIIEIASRKKDYLVYRTSKSRDQFLDLAFKLVSRIFAIHPPDA